MGNAEALNGADFNLCSPAEPATLGFDMKSLGSSGIAAGARSRSGFKVPDRKAVEIGNAIWAKWKARAAGHQGPSRESEPPPALRGHGPVNVSADG